LAALEPKFWAAFVDLIGAEGLAEAAFALGADGERAAAEVGKRLAEHPRDHWLRLSEERGLPVGPVHGFDEAPLDPSFAAAGLIEETPMPGGTSLPGVGPLLPALSRTPNQPAPKLGEHTAAILDELGIRN
jgi:crotonobetainyl-CoA:carnitine CoA-transferase CaiB-like acyl-CoA transferase